MQQNIAFLKPVSGDCLANKAGVLSPDGSTLSVTVRVRAPEGKHILICDEPARFAAGAYFATVKLCQYQNKLTARDEAGNTAEVTVYWLPKATNAYRLSLDDNIHFLRDIAKNSNTYHSVFDNPYLSLLREVHERYGTKVHANLFLETPDRGGFSLLEMPATFKSEFRANADWLRFSFHARAELPHKPYIDTDYMRIAADLAAVREQILRFAGEETYAASTTTVHWGESTVEGIRALHDAGVRVLAGYLQWSEKHDSGVVSYYLNRAQVTNTATYGIWKDEKNDMIFSKIDVVLNSGTLEGITEKLDAAWEAYPQKGFWEFLMHEQYFYPDYKHYLPDFRERMFAALDWAEQHGLTPAFLSETHLKT